MSINNCKPYSIYEIKEPDNQAVRHRPTSFLSCEANLAKVNRVLVGCYCEMKKKRFQAWTEPSLSTTSILAILTSILCDGACLY